MVIPLIELMNCVISLAVMSPSRLSITNPRDGTAMPATMTAPNRNNQWSDKKECKRFSARLFMHFRRVECKRILRRVAGNPWLDLLNAPAQATYIHHTAHSFQAEIP